MASPYDNFMKDFNDSVTLINTVGVDEFVKQMKGKREDIEKILHSPSPFTSEENARIVVDYSSILKEFYSIETEPAHVKREDYEQLIAASFSVGYAIGMGIECAGTLPVLALSGAHLELGKKILQLYLQERQKQKHTNQ